MTEVDAGHELSSVASSVSENVEIAVSPQVGGTPSSGTESPGQRRVSTPSASDGKRFRPFFFFVNPTSGGNAAGVFTNTGMKSIKLCDPNVEVFIYDIRNGDTGSKEGFLRVKAEVDAKPPDDETPTLVVACGGDGTVMWCASELWATGIDDTKCAIGVIPYGTGNDFARVFDWNKYNAMNPFEKKFGVMKKLIAELESAPVALHDVWDAEVVLHPHGMIKQIDSKTRKKKILMEKDQFGGDRPVLRQSYKVNNYFSIGVESRIGVGFDRHRTGSQFGNKMVFANEGFKKVAFKHNTPIQELVGRMIYINDEGEEKILFDTENAMDQSLKPCKSLVAVNIPSFASGLNIWGKSQGKKSTAQAVVPDDLKSMNLTSAVQKIGDGKIEWVTFGSAFKLAAEQSPVKGNATRLYQGAGPFSLVFRKLKEDQRIYFQVDGEFYACTLPDRMNVKLFKQIRVLIHPKCKQMARYCFPGEGELPKQFEVPRGTTPERLYVEPAFSPPEFSDDAEARSRRASDASRRASVPAVETF